MGVEYTQHFREATHSLTMQDKAGERIWNEKEESNLTRFDPGTLLSIMKYNYYAHLRVLV